MKSPIEMSNGRDTVKIYGVTSRGRPCYQLAFYRAGLRERRTFSDKEAAKREAKAILCQLASTAVATERAINATDIESLVAARSALAGIVIPLHLAVEGFAGAVRHLGRPADPVAALHRAISFYVKHHPANAKRVPLNELAEKYLESRKRLGLSKVWLNSIGTTTRNMLKRFPENDCDFPSGQEIAAWLEEKYQSPVTKNSNLKTIKAFTTWAVREKFIATETITRVEFWKQAGSKIEIYTPEELRCILSKVRSEVVPFVAIGAFAGLRASEVVRLDWSEINLERGFITVAASKTKTAARRLVPISENLKAWIKPHAMTSGPVVALGNDRINQLLRAPGLPRKSNALRHSYISYRLAVINDTPKVALECGNSPTMIFKHYRELVEPEMAKAWFEITPVGTESAAL